MEFPVTQPPESVICAGAVLTELVTENGEVRGMGVWLIANRESARANALDPTVPITYQLPKGTVDRGETTEEAAARELSEELGVAVAIGGCHKPSSQAIWARRDCFGVGRQANIHVRSKAPRGCCGRFTARANSRKPGACFNRRKPAV